MKVTVDRALEILDEAKRVAAETAASAEAFGSDDRLDYAQAGEAIRDRLETAGVLGLGELVGEVEVFLAEPIEDWLACDGDLRFWIAETAEARKAWDL